MKLPELKLIQEIETRWNSTYLMIERFLKLKVAISAALVELTSVTTNNLQILNANDWNNLESAAEVIQSHV